MTSYVKGSDIVNYLRQSKLLQRIYNSHIIIISILLLSFYLNLNVFNQLASDSPYFFTIQTATDQDHYIDQAEELSRSTRSANNPFSLSPYYSYYLAGVYRIHQDHVMPRLLQIFLGILVIALAYRMGYMIFTRALGIVSAFLIAIYGPIIFYNLEYNVVSHVTLFIMSAGYLTLVSQKHARTRTRFVIGLLLGLATVAQPQNMVLVFPTVFWIWRRRNSLILSKITSTIATLVGIIFVLAFPIVHNWIATGQPSFITTTGAYNLYIGNNPTSSGTWYKINSEIRPQVESGQTTYLNEVIQFIIHQPDEWLLLMVKKTAFMMIGSDAELGSNFNYHFWGELYSSTLRSLGLRYELIILTVLTTFHLVIINRKTWLLYLYIFTYYWATIAVFIATRYRIPFVPMLIILFVGSLFEIIKRLRQKDYKVLLLVIAVLISYGAVMIRYSLWLETYNFVNP